MGGIGLVAAGLGAASVAFYQACAIYDSSLLLPAADGGAEGGTCNPVRWPDRPAATADDGSAQDYEAVAVLSSIDLGLQASASTDASSPRPLPPYGFDLDNTCTCHPGPPSCVQEKGAPETCDDDGGLDHIGLELFSELGSAAQQGNDQLNQGLQAGQYGLIIDLRHYNGQANDSSVSASVYVSNGVLGVEDGGSATPAHDGTDRWTLDPGSLASGSSLIGTNCDNENSVCQPVFHDDNAYVSNNVLVAAIDFPLSFGVKSFMGGAVMQLKGAHIVGTLTTVRVNGGGLGFAITDGTIAGRWPTSQLLSTLATIPSQLPGAYLCGSDPVYAYVKWRACQVADITSNPGADNTGAHCDAVSMGLRFEAEPAHLGTVFGAPQAPSGCKTDAGLPFTDNCPL
jgi:hypothetical protein